jgi:hypothetical protein
MEHEKSGSSRKLNNNKKKSIARSFRVFSLSLWISLWLLYSSCSMFRRKICYIRFAAEIERKAKTSGLAYQFARQLMQHGNVISIVFSEQQAPFDLTRGWMVRVFSRHRKKFVIADRARVAHEMWRNICKSFKLQMMKKVCQQKTRLFRLLFTFFLDRLV